jgi:hypothetical protein
MSSPESPSLKSLILVPSVITLAVTLLRLVGELQHWSPVFFSRAAGGAGAVVGIVWLVIVFGIYFAWKLASAGPTPPAGRVIGFAALAIALAVGTLTAVVKAGGSQNAQFLAFLVVSVVAAVIAYRGWPALGRVNFVYGLAARIPVVIVMLVAIYANWGTHYDVAPPNLAGTAPLTKWFMIGFMPQMFIWVPFTMCVGALVGGFTLLVVGSRSGATVGGTPRVA